jgi:hypothetical protein
MAGTPAINYLIGNYLRVNFKAVLAIALSRSMSPNAHIADLLSLRLHSLGRFRIEQNNGFRKQLFLRYWYGADRRDD